jgi:thiol-disulfide isomerase/thioredoxin
MRSLAFLCAALVALPAAAEEEIAIGLPAPTFTLKTLNPDVAGAAWIPLERYVGPDAEDAAAKVVLVSFFASWCEPCKKELPFLVALDRDYRELGLRVLGVNIDREDDAVEAARRLVAGAGVRYPVLTDRFNFLARRYLGAEAPLPSVFLVRKDGTIARIERGYTKDASAFLLAEVRLALGLEPLPPAKPVARATRSSSKTPAVKKGAARATKRAAAAR